MSKCGPRVQQRSLEWLRHHRFFELTGIAEGNVRFCLQRPQKAIHCADLGITHFVDDKPDVIAAITPVVPHRYLFKNWVDTEAAIRGIYRPKARRASSRPLRFSAGSAIPVRTSFEHRQAK